MVEIEIDENNYVVNIGSITIGGFILRKSSNVIQDYTPLNILGMRNTFKGYGLDKGDEIIPCVRPEGAGAPLVPCSDKSIKLRL